MTEKVFFLQKNEKSKEAKGDKVKKVKRFLTKKEVKKSKKKCNSEK